MNLILLKGVLPLKKKIVLSKKWGIEIDNPRSKEEVQFVGRLIKNKVEFRNDKKLLEYFLVSDNKALIHKKYLDEALSKLTDHHRGNNFFNKDFLKNYKDTGAHNYLAKNWLVIRFDDKGFFKGLRSSSKKIKGKGLIILEGTEVGPQREDRALKFVSILDLLFLDKLRGHLKKTIILSDDKPTFHQELMIYIMGLAHGRSIHDEFDYFTLADNLEKIIELSKDIEKLSEDQSERLLFIGETIESINTHHMEPKMMLLMLVSVIEFLLTHNPDSQRFNVEDSIGKQFQLKTGIVLNKKIGTDLAQISQKLKNLYGVRSAIAHGDFSSIKAVVKKGKTKDEDFDIFDLVEEVFGYVSAITQTYIHEPDFIDALKKL